MSLAPVFGKIDRISRESKTTEKINLLRTYMKDPIFKEAVILTYDGTLHYGIKKLPNHVTATPTLIKKSGTPEEIFKFLRKLATKRGTSNVDRDHLADLCSEDQETWEIVSKIVNKDMKAGFSARTINNAEPDTIYVIPYMRCSGEKKIKNIEYPAIAQEKADGVFVNIIIEHNGEIRFRSRAGNEVFQLDKLRKAITKITDKAKGIVLMGELLVIKNGKILPRKTGNGIINSCLNETAEQSKADCIVARIWDAVPLEAWIKGYCAIPYLNRFNRCKKLVKFINDRERFNIIDTKRVNNLSEAKKFYKYIRSLDKEGVILKNDSGEWKDHTSPNCIKMKNVSDCELRIKLPVHGKGMKNRHTIGALLCESECGKVQVSVGTGITDIDRNKGWSYWLEQIGQIVTVEFESIITDKKKEGLYSLYLPRFPEDMPEIEIRKDRIRADTYEEIKERMKKGKRKK